MELAAGMGTTGGNDRGASCTPRPRYRYNQLAISCGVAAAFFPLGRSALLASASALTARMYPPRRGAARMTPPALVSFANVPALHASTKSTGGAISPAVTARAYCLLSAGRRAF